MADLEASWQPGEPMSMFGGDPVPGEGGTTMRPPRTWTIVLGAGTITKAEGVCHACGGDVEAIQVVEASALAAAEARADRFARALVECARLSGEEVEDDRAPTWPPVDEWTVRCVRELREDYDALLADLVPREGRPLACRSPGANASAPAPS